MALHMLAFENWLPGVPNPADLLSKELASRQAAGTLDLPSIDLRLHHLPVPLDMPNGVEDLVRQFRSALEQILAQIQPGDLGLGFGQGSPLQRLARLETRFGPDFTHEGASINLDTEGVLTLNPGDAARVIRAVNAGMAQTPETPYGLEQSTDAGGFYCNWLGRALLQNCNGVFVHLPFTSSKEEAEVIGIKFPRMCEGKPSGFATVAQNLQLFRNLAIAMTSPIC